MAFAGRPPDVLYEPFRRRFRTYRFLSHLHSLMVTMSQKSSVPQAVKSVSQALMSDKPTMRRTVGYFINQKFKPPAVIQKLSEYGFVDKNYTKVIATWDATEEAKAAAVGADIELWNFREMMQDIARSIKG